MVSLAAATWIVLAESGMLRCYKADLINHAVIRSQHWWTNTRSSQVILQRLDTATCTQWGKGPKYLEKRFSFLLPHLSRRKGETSKTFNSPQFFTDLDYMWFTSVITGLKLNTADVEHPDLWGNYFDSIDRSNPQNVKATYSQNFNFTAFLM